MVVVLKQGSYSSVLPSQREMNILEYLWLHKAASSSELYQAFGHLWQLRPQVVHGMLQIMLERGFLERHVEQSRAVYKPALSRTELENSILGYVAETFFHGSLSALWSSLVRHPKLRLALEPTAKRLTLEPIRQPN